MRFPDVLNAVVTAWRSVDGYSAPTGRGIPVYDGPVQIAQTPDLYVVLGGSSMDADEDGNPEAGSFSTEQRTMPIGAGTYRETDEVRGAIVAWTGDAPGGIPDWSGLREDAFTCLSDFDQVARTATGLVDAQISYDISDGNVSQMFNDDGAFVVIDFTITADSLN